KTTAEDNFSATSPGREAEYLITMLRELKDKSNWEKYFGKGFVELKFVNDWKKASGSDNKEGWGKWQKQTWEKYNRKFESKKGNINEIIRLTNYRVKELLEEKKRDVKKFTKYVLNKHEKVAPKLKQNYEEMNRKVEETNAKINKYNSIVDETNSNFAALRTNLQKASGNITDEQRRAAISLIPPLFKKVLEGIKEIEKQGLEIRKEMKEYEPLLKDMNKREIIWNKIVGYSAIFEEQYGFELKEEPA
ncbi:MAG: hypothetical protein AABW88_03705, partial [Nanoarchaeota archaeon]